MTGKLRGIVAGLALSVAAVAPGVAQDRAVSVRQEIRHELLQLPYYGVFDFIAFKYDRGTAALMGYAYSTTLAHDAERAVKRVAGVDEVRNAIEQLPAAQNDDELRWKVYYAIYTDPFLSRYAPGSAFLWGHRHNVGPFSGIGGAGFEGMEPAGNYPIHIIVRGGRVTLLGVVDNDGDKTIAGMKARQVPGSFEVTNGLVIEGSHSRRTS